MGGGLVKTAQIGRINEAGPRETDSARRSARRSEPNAVPTCLPSTREIVAHQYDNRARGCENLRIMPGGECYHFYPFGGGTSEVAEFFTKRMITNEKRSVHRTSGTVQPVLEATYA